MVLGKTKSTNWNRASTASSTVRECRSSARVASTSQVQKKVRPALKAVTDHKIVVTVGCRVVCSGSW